RALHADAIAAPCAVAAQGVFKGRDKRGRMTFLLRLRTGCGSRHSTKKEGKARHSKNIAKAAGKPGGRKHWQNPKVHGSVLLNFRLLKLSAGAPRVPDSERPARPRTDHKVWS